MDRIALVKFYLESRFAGDKTISNMTLSTFNPDSKSIFNPKEASVFFDFFFLVLGISICNNMIEEKSKGLKFGLFMSGIRRSSYYAGTLFIPMVLATFYGFTVCILTAIMWKSPKALGPFVVICFVTCYCYVAVLWVIAQIATVPRTANLLLTLFFFGSFITSVSTADMVSNLPASVIQLLCVTPRTGLSVYQYLASFSDAGFSDVSLPYSSPTPNSLVAATIFYCILWWSLAIYLDFLCVSKDETRPFHYLISQFFVGPKVDPVLTDIKYFAKIEENANSLPDSDKIIIKNLSKQYAGSSTYALSNVSLEFGKGEIFGL
jgi:hypothetical protein